MNLQQAMNNLQTYSPNTSPQITQEQNNYSLSVYNDNLDPKNAACEVSRLKLAFPALEVGFFDVLLERIKENGFTDKRLRDAVNNLVDNFVYPTPTIANIISFDKRVKLYSYTQMLDMVMSYGVSAWKEYKAIKLIGSCRFYASIIDIKQYNLEVLK
jgi:hypothetical protein